MRKSKFPMPEKRKNRGLRDIKKDVENLQEYNKKLNNNINAIQQSHSHHIALFSHFLGHDIKNAVQSIDMILSSNSLSELTNEHIAAMQQQLQIIRETLANFTELNPHGESGIFKLNSLIGNVEALNRALFIKNEIVFHKELLQDIELKVNYPFHSLLQVLNNLVINACTHLSLCPNHSRTILLKVAIEQENRFLYLSVYDNGETISEKKQAEIFKYGYTTTPGGSGIGLYHARYICELLQGTIEYQPSDLTNYTKRFLISLPFKPLEL